MTTAAEPSFEIVKPEDLLEKIPDAPIGDQTIAVDLVSGNIDKSSSAGIEGLQFILDAGAALTVHALNSEDDDDEDGVFGAKGKIEDDELEPVIAPSTSAAYLKFRGE